MKNLNDKQKQILEDNFNIYDEIYSDGTCMELEAWTDGGVDMIITIDYEKDIIKGLENYLDNFDVDEEIDIYRQSEDYRSAFRITESVKDFENWVKFIEDIIKQLKEAEENE